eukprot:TRINITY_DN11605_c0_g1_i1.p1 TRINITY_DN11605_c0_g1~~TRINITY_DN11605_c0_g1_i1.p1  ORF type:complete len:291 (+),score=37.01 TRINITY_DN11605_c0_g1_i1:110-982(+)
MASAVRLGAPAGDVAALSSVNTVLAALLGRAFLGEVLQLRHVVAMACSMAGAILISRPSFLFESAAGESDVPSLAYALAVLAGFSMSCIAICARKADKTDVWVFNLSPSAAGISFILASSTPLLDDATLSPLLEHPGQAFGWLALNVVLIAGSIACNSAGSMWCPAAVSATMSSAARILFGYVADIFIFGLRIQLLSVGGAALMMCGVLVMTLARAPRQPEDDASLKEQPETSAVASPPATDTDETESLASFIAAEFVELQGYETPLRQRKPAGAPTSPLASVLGASAQP